MVVRVCVWLANAQRLTTNHGLDGWGWANDSVVTPREIDNQPLTTKSPQGGRLGRPKLPELPKVPELGAELPTLPGPPKFLLKKLSSRNGINLHYNR